MSKVIAAETLKAIPADEFLKTHAQLIGPVSVNFALQSYLRAEARQLFRFGLHLENQTKRAGWFKNRFPPAIRSGSGRLFLTALKYLTPPDPIPTQIETRNWLASADLRVWVAPEVADMTRGSHMSDTVADAAEEELASEYPAFVALSREVPDELFESTNDIGAAGVDRLGMLLAGVAIKRQLNGQPEPVMTHTAESDPTLADLNALFDLPSSPRPD